MVVWNEDHNNFSIYTEPCFDLPLHFLHNESTHLLGLTIPPNNASKRYVLFHQKSCLPDPTTNLNFHQFFDIWEQVLKILFFVGFLVTKFVKSQDSLNPVNPYIFCINESTHLSGLTIPSDKASKKLYIHFILIQQPIWIFANFLTNLKMFDYLKMILERRF